MTGGVVHHVARDRRSAPRCENSPGPPPRVAGSRQTGSRNLCPREPSRPGAECRPRAGCGNGLLHRTPPVDEAESGYAEIQFRCKAGRIGFGRLHVGKRGGMRPRNASTGWATACRARCLPRRAKTPETPRRYGWETVGDMADDVGVNVVGQVEADGHAVRIRVGVEVGNHGHPWSPRTAR